MNRLAYLLITALCACPLAAQVPTDHAVVLEFFSAGPFGATLYSCNDIRGGGRTPIPVPVPFGSPVPTGIAVEASNSQSFWFLDAAGSVAGINQVTMGLLASAQQPWNQPWINAGGERIRAEGGEIFTLRAGGIVERTPISGGAPTQVLQTNFAVDIAVRGARLYVAAFDQANPTVAQPLLEVNLTTGVQRIVGNYVDVRRIAASPASLRCALGTSTAVVEIDTVTGTMQSSIPVANPVQAIAYSGQGWLVYGTGTGVGYELWSQLRPAPIYSSPLSTLIDLDVSFAVGATIVPYGDGCNNGSQVTWTANSVPAAGNSNFVFGIGQAPANTAAALFVGDNRSFSSVMQSALPMDLGTFGAPGCLLLVDPVVPLVFLVDPSGSASRPTPIPNSPILVGIEWSAQAFIFDPGSNPEPWSATQAVALRLN